MIYLLVGGGLTLWSTSFFVISCFVIFVLLFCFSWSLLAVILLFLFFALFLLFLFCFFHLEANEGRRQKERKGRTQKKDTRKRKNGRGRETNKTKNDFRQRVFLFFLVFLWSLLPQKVPKKTEKKKKQGLLLLPHFCRRRGVLSCKFTTIKRRKQEKDGISLSFFIDKSFFVFKDKNSAARDCEPCPGAWGFCSGLPGLWGFCLQIPRERRKTDCTGFRVLQHIGDSHQHQYCCLLASTLVL